MPGENNYYRELTGEEFPALAEALGDTPETVIAAHYLKKGLCRAFVAGTADKFEAAVVQHDDLPDEPAGFGNNPEALWELLKLVRGWSCVNVRPECAPELGRLIRKNLKTEVRFYKDIVCILNKPAVAFTNQYVRRLTVDDIKLLENAPVQLRGSGFGGIKDLLVEGIAAGAVLNNKLAALAHTGALTEKHADIGAYTDEDYRGRGLAVAAASIVAEETRQSGRVPVLSYGEDNAASAKIARKLGFEEISNGTYIIVE